ncbi:MAG: DUF2203 domain-containing protein [Bryobacteraceae bacterium]|nr:DUF2203 domain-containing protein [Bryobacteraceae bacterium]
MPRHFTLAQAERLLPAVERAIRLAIECKARYQEAEQAVEGYTQRLMMLGGAMVNREEILARKQRQQATAADLQQAVEEIQEFGCEVKDLDIGLIDFRCYYRGEEVYLCWKLGEDGITHWHGLEEGFRGRKAIDQEFLDNHRGDSPN